MKTSLKFTSLFFAVSLPAAMAAEFAGVSLPPAVDPMTAFLALVGSMVVLLAWGDYSRRESRVLARVNATPKAAHPLAA